VGPPPTLCVRVCPGQASLSLRVPGRADAVSDTLGQNCWVVFGSTQEAVGPSKVFLQSGQPVQVPLPCDSAGTTLEGPQIALTVDLRISRSTRSGPTCAYNGHIAVSAIHRLRVPPASGQTRYNIPFMLQGDGHTDDALLYAHAAIADYETYGGRAEQNAADTRAFIARLQQT
jgi:hypothetical protein